MPKGDVILYGNCSSRKVFRRLRFAGLGGPQAQKTGTLNAVMIIVR